MRSELAQVDRRSENHVLAAGAGVRRWDGTTWTTEIADGSFHAIFGSVDSGYVVVGDNGLIEEDPLPGTIGAWPWSCGMSLAERLTITTTKVVGTPSCYFE